MPAPPLIGLSSSHGRMTDWDKSARLPQHRLNANYIDSVILAGGVPVILAPAQGGIGAGEGGALEGQAESVMGRIQGLILTGGGDLTEYKPKPPGLSDELFDMDKLRDEWEKALLRAAEAARRPVFGICRGIQVMNSHFGGTLHRDIPSEVPGALRHIQSSPRTETSHEVALEKGSLVAEICGAESLMVNSGHHQAPKDPGRGFLVAGRAPDGIIEAMEHKSLPFCLGVQWHPEGLARGHAEALALFQALVRRAAEVGA